jgi:hypothetical protein
MVEESYTSTSETNTGSTNSVIAMISEHVMSASVASESTDSVTPDWSYTLIHPIMVAVAISEIVVESTTEIDESILASTVSVAADDSEIETDIDTTPLVAS